MIRTRLGDAQGHVVSRSLDRLNVLRVRTVNESESIFAITSNQKRWLRRLNVDSSSYRDSLILARNSQFDVLDKSVFMNEN